MSEQSLHHDLMRQEATGNFTKVTIIQVENLKITGSRALYHPSHKIGNDKYTNIGFSRIHKVLLLFLNGSLTVRLVYLRYSIVI